MEDLGLQPSVFNGYERTGGWYFDQLVGLWSPLLGYQGNSLHDFSGYGRAGILTNMDVQTDWVVSEDGRALSYDGTADRVVVPSSNLYDGSDKFTFAVRVRPKNAGDGGVFSKRAGSNTWQLWQLSNRFHFRIYIGSSAKSIGGSMTLPSGENILLIGTYDGTTMRTYVDGVLDQTLAVTGNIAATTSDVWIGAAINDTFTINGDIDFAAIWRRAISPDQARLLTLNPLRGFRAIENPKGFVASGGGPTFNPVWALGPGSIIGGPVFA